MRNIHFHLGIDFVNTNLDGSLDTDIETDDDVTDE